MISRKKKTVVALQPRDIRLLACIGAMIYVTRSQLLRSGDWPSLDRLRRRVLRLVRGGLIEAISIGSTTEQLLRLTPGGLDSLRDVSPLAAQRVKLPRGGLRISSVPHRLAVVDTRLWLGALLSEGLVKEGSGRTIGRFAPRARFELRSAKRDIVRPSECVGGRLVVWAGPGAELQQQLQLPALGLAPDGVAMLDFEDAHPKTKGQPGRSVIGLEIDLGTEGGRVVASRHAKYAPAIRTGRIHEVWWVVAGGQRRIDSIAKSAVAAGLGDVVRVFSHGLTVPRPARVPPPVLSATAVAGRSNSDAQVPHDLAHPPDPALRSDDATYPDAEVHGLASAARGDWCPGTLKSNGSVAQHREQSQGLSGRAPGDDGIPGRTAVRSPCRTAEGPRRTPWRAG